MNIKGIIEKKRDGKILTKEEIEFFIKGYVEGDISDYQASALIMAIYLNGMNQKETTYLTLAMANSGEVLDLSEIGENIIDKHSTGGVGDKASLCVLPLVASLGVVVAKMSGRGLGYTGGTVDKLQSIPAYRTDLEIDEFKNNIKNIGISMISHTGNIAPADKKIYSLRDSISCVESIPLIASSIMSKKIASGAQKIVIDVTVGAGAFMKTKKDARALAKEMINIGKLANKEIICILTNMDEPLGYAIGNNLEVIETVKFLQGDMPEDLKEVVFEIGANMIKLAGYGEDLEDNKRRMLESINNGQAFEKFVQMVENQNGDATYLKNLEKLPKAYCIEEIRAVNSGYISSMNAEELGKIACKLGAGRLRKEDDIDKTVGIVLNKKVSEYVNEGDILATIYANDIEKLAKAKEKIAKIIKISNKEIKKPEIIYNIYR